MDALEELRGFLDNDQFVSFRWLAVFLDVNVEKSKIILEKFKSSNSDVSATYCVSGQLKNKQQSISVVSEKNLAKCKEMFEHVNCTHIYSLQKIKLAESLNAPVQLNTADVQQGIEQIALQPTCVLQLLNSNGGVRLDGNEIKPVGKRAQAIVRSISTSNKSSTSGNAERNVMKAFSSASNNAKDKCGTAALSSSSAKDISAEKTKDKSKSTASAFFANTASATAEKSDAIKVTKASAANAATNSTSGRLRKAESNDDDDDDEWTEEGAASYKPDKAKLQTRKVVRNATNTEECSEIPCATPLTVDEIDGKNTKSVETKKSQLHVHGAMDDYMEDVAIEQFNAGQAVDAVEPPADGKRTKRKLVEKVREILTVAED
jgi:DNA polymerase subunit Cdc27